MLRILGQLASTVALLFAAAALIGTAYLAGYLGGVGVSLTTVRLDPGTAVITALVPTIYLLPALLVVFGYVFSVAVGLAGVDAPAGPGRRPGRPSFRQRWFDEALLEGVGFALIAAVLSVGVLARHALPPEPATHAGRAARERARARRGGGARHLPGPLDREQRAVPAAHAGVVGGARDHRVGDPGRDRHVHPGRGRCAPVHRSAGRRVAARDADHDPRCAAGDRPVRCGHAARRPDLRRGR